MKVALWDSLIVPILDQINAKKDDYIAKICTEIFYAIISAIVWLIIGFIVYFIVMYVPQPTIIIYIIGIILAYTNFIFEPPSIPTTVIGALGGGLITAGILIISYAIIDLVNVNSWPYEVYIFYVIVFSIIFFIVYWIASDIRFNETRGSWY
jgi:hypothetical protein